MKKINLHFGFLKDGELFTLPKCLMLVPIDRYTDEPDKVTCKRCRRILEKLWSEHTACLPFSHASKPKAPRRPVSDHDRDPG